MQCKTENPGRGEFECLKEGRRVTRCARSVYVPLFYSMFRGWIGILGLGNGGPMGTDCATDSRTSTSPASSSSAPTGSASKTTTSSCGNAAPPSGSLTSVSTTTWCVSKPSSGHDPPADLTALAEPREGHPRPAQAVDTGAPKTEAGLCPQMDPAVGEAVCSGPV